MKKLILVLGSIAAAAALVACGGGGGDSAPAVAASDVVLGITPATGVAAITAVSDQAFNFASGVPAFGTTGTTTLVLSQPTSGTPTFAITNNGQTTTGTVTFGSCIFRVNSAGSTNPALAQGALITINPCNVKVRANGNLVADGLPKNAEVTITLGTTESSPKTVANVVVASNGTVTINGANVGNVELKLVTGS